MIEILKGKVGNNQTHYESHGGGQDATLHTKFWLTLENGKDKYFHLKNTELQIKNNHQVSLFYIQDDLVGYINNNASHYTVLQKKYNLYIIGMATVFVFLASYVANTMFILFALFMIGFSAYSFREGIRLYNKVEETIKDNLNS